MSQAVHFDDFGCACGGKVKLHPAPAGGLAASVEHLGDCTAADADELVLDGFRFARDDGEQP